MFGSLNMHLLVVCIRWVQQSWRGARRPSQVTVNSLKPAEWNLKMARFSCRLPSSSPPPLLSAAASSPAPPSSGPRCVLAPQPSAHPRPRRTCACVVDDTSLLWTLYWLYILWTFMNPATTNQEGRATFIKRDDSSLIQLWNNSKSVSERQGSHFPLARCHSKWNG